MNIPYEVVYYLLFYFLDRRLPPARMEGSESLMRLYTNHSSAMTLSVLVPVCRGSVGREYLLGE